MDPTTLALIAASLLGTAGGTYMDYLHNQDVNDAQEEFASLEALRQSRLQEEANSYIQPAIDRFSRDAQNESLDTTYEAKKDRYQENVSKAEPLSVFRKTANPIVRSAEGSSLARAYSDSMDDAGRRAKLEAYGDSALGDNVALSRSGNMVGTLNNFSRGSNSAMNSELRGARMGGPSILSPILKGLGSMAGMGAGWTYADSLPKVPVSDEMMKALGATQKQAKMI